MKNIAKIIRKNLGLKSSNTLLVGSKSDLQFERTVSFEECQELANELKITYIEISSEHHITVNEAI